MVSTCTSFEFVTDCQGRESHLDISVSNIELHLYKIQYISDIFFLQLEKEELHNNPIILHTNVKNEASSA